MHIRYGFNIEIEVVQPTTILTMMDVEPARRHAIIEERPFRATGVEGSESYIDAFGNLCRRVRALPGTVGLSLDGVISDHGEPDTVAPDAAAAAIAELPTETLPFLLGSR